MESQKGALDRWIDGKGAMDRWIGEKGAMGGGITVA
jgi:hypothetical protein